VRVTWDIALLGISASAIQRCTIRRREEASHEEVLAAGSCWSPASLLALRILAQMGVNS